MDEQRLIDIEMKLAYQERMISELNTVVVDQQKAIDELQKTSGLLLNRVVELSQNVGQPEIVDEKPPHY
jgi:SlyX protein